jgi:hypothetical protein
MPPKEESTPPEAPDSRDPTADLITTVEPPFFLPEYQGAFIKFIQNALKVLSNAKDPILRQLRSQRKPTRSYLGRNSLPGGQTLESAPLPTRTEFLMQMLELMEGDVDVLGQQLKAGATAYTDSLMSQIYAAMADSATAVGNAVDAGGEPFSADLFIEMLERTEVHFDKAGTPQLQIIIPEGIHISDPSEDEQRRINEVIDRKRTEFFAQRRSRELPRHPLGT